MLENSLRIRQKFINKVANKINELNSDFILLKRVDRKISKSNRLQRGGAGIDLKDLQEEALIKRLQIEQQNEDLRTAINQAQELTSKVAEINGALTQIKDEISKIDIQAVDLAGIDVPDVTAANAIVMQNVGTYKLSPLCENGVLIIPGVDDKTLAKHKHTTDTYRDLFIKAINTVFKTSVTAQDIALLRSNMKQDKVWSGIVDSGSTVINAVDGKKLGITEKIYEKLRSNNPAAELTAADAAATAGPGASPTAVDPAAAAAASGASGASGSTRSGTARSTASPGAAAAAGNTGSAGNAGNAGSPSNAGIRKYLW